VRGGGIQINATPAHFHPFGSRQNGGMPADTDFSRFALLCRDVPVRFVRESGMSRFACSESELHRPVTFRWLTVQVVAECLARSGLDRKDEARLMALVDESTRREYAQRFEVALERMG
jgi:hypothetical protein